MDRRLPALEAARGQDGDVGQDRHERFEDFRI
jgi:hypothetical protein